MNAAPSTRPRHAVAPFEQRKHLRMQGWDFTSPGWYFLTICTKDMKPVFGKPIFSSFLSPMERAVFRAGLARKRPMIWVLPHGLDAVNSHTACRAAIQEGLLLVLSPYDAALDAPNARRAAWCNQYVLAHCDRAVVGHLNPDGMLACILAEADPDKEVIRL